MVTPGFWSKGQAKIWQDRESSKWGNGDKAHSEEFKGGVRLAEAWRSRVALDNAFIERVWRSVKCEDMCLPDDADGVAVGEGLARCFRFGNPDAALRSVT